MQTLEEYVSHYLDIDGHTKEQIPITEPRPTKAIKEGMALPSVVDWRKQGVVTAIKDQVRKGRGTPGSQILSMF